jgi:hypothetical protein
MFVEFAFIILFSVLFGLYVRDEYEKENQPRPQVQNTVVLTTFSTTVFIDVPITMFRTHSTTLITTSTRTIIELRPKTLTRISILGTNVPSTTTMQTAVTQTVELINIVPSSVSVCWNLL